MSLTAAGKGKENEVLKEELIWMKATSGLNIDLNSEPSSEPSASS